MVDCSNSPTFSSTAFCKASAGTRLTGQVLKFRLVSSVHQLLQLIRNDDDNETAYLMLASIAGQRKVYPEQVYYSYMAHKLNPLSAENKAKYINSLLFAREFERLENFLSYQSNLFDDLK